MTRRGRTAETRARSRVARCDERAFAELLLRRNRTACSRAWIHRAAPESCEARSRPCHRSARGSTAVRTRAERGAAEICAARHRAHHSSARSVARDQARRGRRPRIGSREPASARPTLRRAALSRNRACTRRPARVERLPDDQRVRAGREVCSTRRTRLSSWSSAQLLSRCRGTTAVLSRDLIETEIRWRARAALLLVVRDALCAHGVGLNSASTGRLAPDGDRRSCSRFACCRPARRLRRQAMPLGSPCTSLADLRVGSGCAARLLRAARRATPDAGGGRGDRLVANDGAACISAHAQRRRSASSAPSGAFTSVPPHSLHDLRRSPQRAPNSRQGSATCRGDGPAPYRAVLPSGASASTLSAADRPDAAVAADRVRDLTSRSPGPRALSVRHASTATVSQNVVAGVGASWIADPELPARAAAARSWRRSAADDRSVAARPSARSPTVSHELLCARGLPGCAPQHSRRLRYLQSVSPAGAAVRARSASAPLASSSRSPTARSRRLVLRSAPVADEQVIADAPPAPVPISRRTARRLIRAPVDRRDDPAPAPL